jgi:hypothetical protein
VVRICPIGRFWPIDADGFIQNDAAPEKILPPYSGLVAEVRDAYLEHLGQRVHSIYVRGTMARGIAVEGVSDLDSFALVSCAQESPDLSWVGEVAERLRSRHPCVTGIELGCVDRDEIGSTVRFSELDLLMVTQTACVWGEDVTPYLPRYKPGILVANSDISQIGLDIKEALVGLEVDPSPQNGRYWCRRIAKNIIRAGFSFTILRKRLYTRDLYPCYRVFANQYPKQESGMRRAVEYALDPSPNVEEVRAFLSDFGGWMIEAAEDWLDLHNPSRQLALAYCRHQEEVKFGGDPDAQWQMPYERREADRPPQRSRPGDHR